MLIFCFSFFIIYVVLVFSLLAVGIQLLFAKLLLVGVCFNIILILMKMLGENVFYSQPVLTFGHLGSRRSWVHGSKLPKLQHERWDSGLCL